MERREAAGSSGRGQPASTAVRERPDARPARLMMGAAAFAAVTVIGAGLVEFPSTAALDTSPAPAGGELTKAKPTKVQRPVKYVRLKPGQQAPKGAKVIKEAAPTPRVVVRRIVTPAASGSSNTATRRAARSRQSGG